MAAAAVLMWKRISGITTYRHRLKKQHRKSILITLRDEVFTWTEGRNN